MPSSVTRPNLLGSLPCLTAGFFIAGCFMAPGFGTDDPLGTATAVRCGREPGVGRELGVGREAGVGTGAVPEAVASSIRKPANLVGSRVHLALMVLASCGADGCRLDDHWLNRGSIGSAALDSEGRNLFNNVKATGDSAPNGVAGWQGRVAIDDEELRPGRSSAGIRHRYSAGGVVGLSLGRQVLVGDRVARATSAVTRGVAALENEDALRRESVALGFVVEAVLSEKDLRGDGEWGGRWEGFDRDRSAIRHEGDLRRLLGQG